MCDEIFMEPTETTQDIFALKKVRRKNSFIYTEMPKVFISLFDPKNRTKIHTNSTSTAIFTNKLDRGKAVLYEIDKLSTVNSLGMMCYTNSMNPKNIRGGIILEVLIPKGSIIQFGYIYDEKFENTIWHEELIILTNQLIPKRVIPWHSF